MNYWILDKEDLRLFVPEFVIMGDTDKKTHMFIASQNLYSVLDVPSGLMI